MLAIKSDTRYRFFKIELRPFFRTRSFRNHGDEKILEAKPLTFLWKYWKWLKSGETSIAVFRHHVPLHTILSTKRFFTDRTEQSHVNSSGAECRLRKRKNVEHLYRFTSIKFQCFLPPPPPPNSVLFSLHHHHHHRHHHISTFTSPSLIQLEHIFIPEENKRILLPYKDALLDLTRPNVPYKTKKRVLVQEGSGLLNMY